MKIKIDDIFRIDTRYNFNLISDNCFRGARWESRNKGDAGMYRHKIFLDILNKLSQGQSIYRICFFASFEMLLKNTRDTYLNTDIIIHKASREIVGKSGFTRSWDDGFLEGEAYLFYCIENNIHDRSQAAIPFQSLVDVTEEYKKEIYLLIGK